MSTMINKMINKIGLTQNSIYLFQTGCVENKRIISCVSKNKSPGHDNISTNVLQLSEECVTIAWFQIRMKR